MRRLLAGLGGLNTGSPPFEVIVVDDGSDPPLSIDVNAYNYPLSVIDQRNAGPAQARNNGARLARGTFLVFIDDDCLPHPDWLIGFDEHCGDNLEVLLGGQTLNGLKNNRYAQSTQLLIDFLLKHYNPADVKGGFFPTNNMVVARIPFCSLNGFNPSLTFGEDRELCYRWELQNHRFKWIREAKAFHFHDLNFLSFLRLHAKYGSGSFRFHQIAARELRSPVSLSPFTFYLKLICHPFSSGFSIQALQLTFLLFCTQAANFCGMALQWGKTTIGFKK